MKLKRKKHNHKKKILKEKIEINRMRVKFEEKKMRGWIILDWRAKLKRKINSKKIIKRKKPLKEWGPNLKNLTN